MRYLILSLSCVALLAGCQSHKVVEESPATLTATLPEVDTSKAPGMLEQYHVGAFTVGGWVNQKLGQFFTPIQPQNAQAAVVYLYRPDTRWNRQEIAAANLQTASFNIKGMTCAIGCAKTIQEELNGLDGVQTATVDFDKELATVSFDKTLLTPEKLTKVVEAAADGKTYKVSNVKL